MQLEFGVKMFECSGDESIDVRSVNVEQWYQHPSTNVAGCVSESKIHKLSAPENRFFIVGRELNSRVTISRSLAVVHQFERQ